MLQTLINITTLFFIGVAITSTITFIKIECDEEEESSLCVIKRCLYKPLYTQEQAMTICKKNIIFITLLMTTICVITGTVTFVYDGNYYVLVSAILSPIILMTLWKTILICIGSTKLLHKVAQKIANKC